MTLNLEVIFYFLVRPIQGFNILVKKGKPIPLKKAHNVLWLNFCALILVSMFNISNTN